MRIAVCLSGQFRGNLNTCKKMLDSVIGQDYDIYVDLWKKKGRSSAIDRILPVGYSHYFHSNGRLSSFNIEEFFCKYPVLSDGFFSADSVSEEEIRKVFLEAQVFIEDDPEDFLTSKALHNISYPEFLQNRNPRDVYCMLMFYKIYSCMCRVVSSGQDYDYVIRVRSDLDISHQFKIDFTKIQLDQVWVRDTPSISHMDDQFAVGSFHAMQKYSNLWLDLFDYWFGNKPTYEVSGFLLKHHLDLNNINIIKNKWPMYLTTDRLSLNDFWNLLVGQYASEEDSKILKIANELIADIFHDDINKNGLKQIEKYPVYLQRYINSFNSNSLQLKASYYEKIKNYHKAINLYNSALGYDSSSFVASTGIARCWHKLEAIDKSIAYWMYSHSLRPRDWICIRELINCYLIIKNIGGANMWIVTMEKILGKEHQQVILLKNRLNNIKDEEKLGE